MGLNYSIAMLKNPQNQDESAKAYACLLYTSDAADE